MTLEEINARLIHLTQANDPEEYEGIRGSLAWDFVEFVGYPERSTIGSPGLSELQEMARLIMTSEAIKCPPW